MRGVQRLHPPAGQAQTQTVPAETRRQSGARRRDGRRTDDGSSAYHEYDPPARQRAHAGSVAGMDEQGLATAAPVAEAKETEQEGGQKTDEESGMQKRCLRRYYDASCRADAQVVLSHPACTTDAQDLRQVQLWSQVRVQEAGLSGRSQRPSSTTNCGPPRRHLSHLGTYWGRAPATFSVGKKRAIVEA